MRIGLYQCPSPAGNLALGLEKIDVALGQAAAADVDMLVMPELFLPGYNATLSSDDVNVTGLRDAIEQLVQKHATALSIGLPWRQAGKIFNTAFAFASNGDLLAEYAKIQLYGDDEARTFEVGNAYATFDYLGKTFGLLICYDVEFAQHVRALVNLGAEIVLVPTANMMPYVNVSEIIVPARAAENAITVVYANYCGSEGHLDYCGQSGIFGPDGYGLAVMKQETGLCWADVPESENASKIPNSTQIADYRALKETS